MTDHPHDVILRNYPYPKYTALAHVASLLYGDTLGQGESFGMGNYGDAF
jgi:hypothetical protein